MPALSWNEIRQNAIQFSREWKNARKERAESQTFWNEFFQVFGIRRRTVASFEEPVKSLKDTYRRIDLFWKGRLLAEHKSAGERLDDAEAQAFQYIQDLAASGRDDEIPRYIILCNFESMLLYDLEPEETIGPPFICRPGHARLLFSLGDLHEHIKHFAFIIGQKIHRFGEEDEANLKAAALMADLHDAVAGGKYPADSLERLLVLREEYLDHGATLADIYDILCAPAELVKAHRALDRAVDRCYRSKPFASERERVEFLFQLYEQLCAPLAPAPPPKAKPRPGKPKAARQAAPAKRIVRPPRDSGRLSPRGDDFFFFQEIV